MALSWLLFQHVIQKKWAKFCSVAAYQLSLLSTLRLLLLMISAYYSLDIFTCNCCKDQRSAMRSKKQGELAKQVGLIANHAVVGTNIQINVNGKSLPTKKGTIKHMSFIQGPVHADSKTECISQIVLST